MFEGIRSNWNWMQNVFKKKYFAMPRKVGALKSSLTSLKYSINKTFELGKTRYTSRNWVKEDIGNGKPGKNPVILTEIEQNFGSTL